ARCGQARQHRSPARPAAPGQLFPCLQAHHPAWLLHFGNRVRPGTQAANHSRRPARLHRDWPRPWRRLREHPKENRMATTAYDAIIVGSGITGGWAAKELTEKGLNTLVLEAGRSIVPERDYVEHVPVWELKYRGWDYRNERSQTQPVQRECYYACDEYS